MVSAWIKQLVVSEYNIPHYHCADGEFQVPLDGQLIVEPRIRTEQRSQLPQMSPYCKATILIHFQNFILDK